jgi:hypothetical protein
MSKQSTYTTERRREVATRHGKTKSPEHRAWAAMRQRCGNPNNPQYQYWGGKGVKVCARWQRFENLYADMGPRPSPEHSIDRIDVNGDYEPGNCRWATSGQQSLNKTSNKLVSFAGETRAVAEWAKLYGIDRGVLGHRLERGWDMERALTTPTEDQTGALYTYQGKTQSISAWAKEYGMSRHMLKGRLQRSKWPIEKALTLPPTPLALSNQISKQFKPGYSTRWRKPGADDE